MNVIPGLKRLRFPALADEILNNWEVFFSPFDDLKFKL
jgi:hypothetical protein